MAGNQNTSLTAEYDPDCLPDLLPIYYKKLFPYGPYYRWLNYGGVPKSYFTHREFSFTLKDDIYLRYQSFSDQSELEKEIQKRCPYKIDIGAIFTHRPKDQKTVKAAAFQAQEKELVFDIDMTDYDDVRNCCSGADICVKCWPLMTIAIKIVDAALREDFGYEHLLWVYSGRRGVHCWVCDEGARKLSQSGRSAIAEYLSVVKGGENQIKKVALGEPQNIHPSIERAIHIVDEHFEDYAVDQQDFLGDEERVGKVLALVAEEGIRAQLEEDFAKFEETGKTSSDFRWKIIRKRTTDVQNQNSSNLKKCQNMDTEIMLQYCYPRLDVNVSKGLNHLLKSPFCVHPKTGKVCIPMDPNDLESFNPMTVPTISQLCEELNEVAKPTNEDEKENKKRIKDYKQTSLKDSMLIFDDFLTNLQSTWKGKLIEQSDKQIDF